MPAQAWRFQERGTSAQAHGAPALREHGSRPVRCMLDPCLPADRSRSTAQRQGSR